jgi:hypothetical protein
MKHTIITLVAFCLISCQSSEKEYETATPEVETESNSKKKVNQAFWDKIASLKGKTFEGEVLEAPDGNDFEDKKLIMHVLDVKTDTIYIPFIVGDNRSRTWVLTKSNNGIQLKHDHRKEDGSEDDVTMYGGITPNKGFDGFAMFPADQETVDLLPGTATNLWWITIDDSRFSYNLRRIGSEVKYSIEFDLKSPAETPQRSWGWENYQLE